jgi:hypothetical protein
LVGDARGASGLACSQSDKSEEKQNHLQQKKLTPFLKQSHLQNHSNVHQYTLKIEPIKEQKNREKKKRKKRR